MMRVMFHKSHLIDPTTHLNPTWIWEIREYKRRAGLRRDVECPRWWSIKNAIEFGDALFSFKPGDPLPRLKIACLPRADDESLIAAMMNGIKSLFNFLFVFLYRARRVRRQKKNKNTSAVINSVSIGEKRFRAEWGASKPTQRCNLRRKTMRESFTRDQDATREWQFLAHLPSKILQFAICTKRVIVIIREVDTRLSIIGVINTGDRVTLTGWC